MRPHLYLSRTRQSPEGELALEFGLKIGYWPCLKGPFVSIAFGYRRLDLWYGLPSIWPGNQPPPNEL